MPDEKVGTPDASQQGSGEPEQQPTTSAPQGTPENAETLKARLEEKEKFIGRQANEIGELRAAMGRLQSLVEGQQLERQREPEPEPAPDLGTPHFGWDWDKPVESAEAIAERVAEKRLRQIEAERAKREAERMAVDAKSSFFEGKEAAFKGPDKHLFEGIEDQVAQLVYESYRNGIINTHSLANPKTWQKAAQLYWLEKGDYSRLVPKPIQPTKPTQTETPAGKPVGTEEFVFEIDEETRRWGHEQGLTDKQIEELYQKELRAVREGKNRATRRY